MASRLVDACMTLIKQYTVALTGGAGSGKSTVAGVISELGYPCVAADDLARQVVIPGSEGLRLIVEHFGSECLTEGGELDRAALRSKVFGATAARRKLEEITHPLIHEAFAESLESAGLLLRPQLNFYDAALVFESGRASLFREVWVCHCPPDVQVERICQRDGVPRAVAEQIIAAQMTSEKKMKLADRLIDTSGSEAHTVRLVRDALRTVVTQGAQ